MQAIGEFLSAQMNLDEYLASRAPIVRLARKRARAMVIKQERANRINWSSLYP